MKQYSIANYVTDGSIWYKLAQTWQLATRHELTVLIEKDDPTEVPQSQTGARADEVSPSGVGPSFFENGQQAAVCGRFIV